MVIDPTWMGTFLGAAGVGAGWAGKFLFTEHKKRKRNSGTETDYMLKPAGASTDKIMSEFMQAQREDRREYREILKEFVGEFREVSKCLQEVVHNVNGNTDAICNLHEDLKERIQRLERNKGG